jgi:hypothetical protein
VTTELARMMLSGKRPWAHASLADVFDEGLAVRYRAFPQKRANCFASTAARCRYCP